MYVDPITRQTFEYANQTPCENNPQNVISLDPDTNQYYVLTPQPNKKTLLYFSNLLKYKPLLALTPLLLQMQVFILKKNPCTIFGIFGIVYYLQNTLLILNTLQLLGKASSYEFMKKQSSEPLSDNPYRSPRIGLHDYMLNLTPFFYPDWFTNALIKLFGYLCFYLTQCGIYFSTALFLQFPFNTLLSTYRSFIVKNLLKKQISVTSALGFGFFGTITQTLMTAMIDSSDSQSDSDDFHSLHPPPSNSHTKSSYSKPKSSNY